MTSTAPLFSLQAPKDISIDDIEAELRAIWQQYDLSEEGVSAVRASTFTMVIYEPEPIQSLLEALGFYTGPIDGISGGRTSAAIKAAQKTYGLAETGNSTPDLLKKLQEYILKEKESGVKSIYRSSELAPDLAGAAIADAVSLSNPCRIITLCPVAEIDDGVKVQVSAYCPVKKSSTNTLVCCEYITLKGTIDALERIGGMITELMIPELPKFLWWKSSPDPNFSLFQRLAEDTKAIIIDSSNFVQPSFDIFQVSQMLSKKIPMADLNWSRLAPWLELTAQAFDPLERRLMIKEVDEVEIDYERGNEAQALMYLSWLASRLQWQPVSYQHEGGDYNLIKITFKSEANKLIEAELAAIPLGEPGLISGDLVSLRLNSANSSANCCTVLCSSTRGCMRMEAGGGAQSCYVQNVTSLADQKTEDLIGQQLQRAGADLLYIETMEITKTILSLKS
jgi:glucose-6-phosphate dehydrogenase assembly protein OpcA